MSTVIGDQLLYFTSPCFAREGKDFFFLSDRTGHPNIFLYELDTGQVRRLTDNARGTLRAYKYFTAFRQKGLGKASVSLYPAGARAYYLQDRQICCVDRGGKRRVLAELPAGVMSAYTSVSGDGTRLCVPTIDERVFKGIDFLGGAYSFHEIDRRCKAWRVSSLLRLYDTHTGRELCAEEVRDAWVTHVQFCPADPGLILYNHEWCSRSGQERMWLWEGTSHRPLRTIASGRRPEDWVCHEVWAPDGKSILYHGTHQGGADFIGRIDPGQEGTIEIPFERSYRWYGHFSPASDTLLVCDGNYEEPQPVDFLPSAAGDAGAQRSAASPAAAASWKRFVPASIKRLLGRKPYRPRFGGEWISLLAVDWQKRRLRWTPLCRHCSSWASEDRHPHPVFSEDRTRVLFNSDAAGKTMIRCVGVPAGARAGMDG